MLICETDRFSMATRQYPRLALFAIAIKRPDGVNHKLRIKISARCHHRLARRQSANLADDLSALGKDGRTSRVMDCSIHSASSEQGRVRSVHNRVNDCSVISAGPSIEIIFLRTSRSRIENRVGFSRELTTSTENCLSHFFSVSASTPGNFRPSRNSSDAPPPVEM